jgi:hypothetical protein
MRPDRKRVSATVETHANPAWLTMPNGSEVYEPNTKRLKGYVVNHAPGKNRCEAYDAKRQTLGTGTHTDCLLMLSTPRAVRVASEVFMADKPKRRG